VTVPRGGVESDSSLRRGLDIRDVVADWQFTVVSVYVCQTAKALRTMGASDGGSVLDQYYIITDFLFASALPTAAPRRIAWIW
jgi:hypothetical protein